MTCSIRFAHNNFFGAGATSSTMASGFPLANAYDTRRGKVAKFRGNFEVTSTANKIYINDGADVTATLTAAEYTGTTLAAHIQTQLNTVSSNWACTYSSTTYKFTISRSAGTAILKLSTTTDAAWDLIGFTALSDLPTSPFIADESRIHSEEWIKIDLGMIQEVGFFGFIGAITAPIGLSNGAVVKIQGNNIDVWTNPPTEVTATISGGAFAMPDASHRFWRVSIKDRENPAGPSALAISYLSIASAVTFAVTNIANGFSISHTDPTIVSQSENGTKYFDIRPKYWNLSGEVQIVLGDERREFEQFAYDAGVSQPFFISVDPKLVTFSSHNEVTKFVYFNEPPQFQHIIRDYFNISLSVAEAV